MFVIGLTGEKLAGKGTASRYIIDKYQAKHYRFSKILEDITERLYLPKTRDNLIDVALAIRSKYGNEIFAHVLKKDIEKNNPDMAIIDGIRYWEEYHILKTLPNFILVYITAPIDVRYARAKLRNEKVDEKQMTFEAFKKQEEAPTEVIIKEIAKEANYTINNIDTEAKMIEQLENIIKQLKK